MTTPDPDQIDDLGDRLETAIKTLDESRRQLAGAFSAMHRTKHPRLNSYLGMAHRRGFTLNELSLMLGCTSQRVHQRIAAGDPAPSFVIDETAARKLLALHAEADGRAPGRRDSTRAYRAELARLRECGATMQQLADVLRVTHAAVWQQIRRNRRTEETP